MSTDRELLELAANASGITVKFFNFAGEPVIAETGGGPESCLVRIWDPLKSDGDALRLAVSLRISVDFDRQYCEALVFGQSCVEEAIGPDALASTRRAIVRAAAEIGR